MAATDKKENSNAFAWMDEVFTAPAGNGRDDYKTISTQSGSKK